MKKTFFLWLSMAAITVSTGQGSTLYEVNVVKPKAGVRTAFETSWKLHLDKYHQKNDKRNVYEVASGPASGSYVIVEGPFSYADMDKKLANEKDHDIDLDKNFDPKLEPAPQNFMVRFADTLSHNVDPNADKLLVTVTVIKDGKMADYMAEMRRTAIISGKLNSPFSYATMVKTQAGTAPTLITLRSLKNGFQELDPNYFNLPQNGFRDAYLKEYGQEAWDKRVRMLVDDVVSREVHFEKYRPDLSSKQ